MLNNIVPLSPWGCSLRSHPGAGSVMLPPLCWVHPPGLELTCRGREMMGSALLPKDQNCRQRGVVVAVRGVLQPTPCRGILLWAWGDHPWKVGQSLQLGPSYAQAMGQVGSFQQENWVFRVCCRMHCSPLWCGLGSAQVNDVHFHTECSPVSFSLGLSDGFWNLKTRGMLVHVVLLKLKQ